MLTLVPEHVAGTLLLRADGEVDISNADELTRAIVESPAAVVVLDRSITRSASCARRTARS
jgi:hypothetical protein